MHTPELHMHAGPECPLESVTVKDPGCGMVIDPGHGVEKSTSSMRPDLPVHISDNGAVR